jgi:hypothetical protein
MLSRAFGQVNQSDEVPATRAPMGIGIGKVVRQFGGRGMFAIVKVVR